MRGSRKDAAIAALWHTHVAKIKCIRELPKLFLSRKRQRSSVGKPKQVESSSMILQDEVTPPCNVSTHGGSGRPEIDGWRAKCDSLAKDALKSCGLSQDWCVELYSSCVERALEAVHTIPIEIALRIANEVFDYRTPTEREQTARWNAKNGYCQHGITKDCCPLGCGSVSDGD